MRRVEPASATRRSGARLSSLLQRSILLAAALATLLFALPLAVAVNGLYRAEASAKLARDAERVRAALTDKLPADGGPITTAIPVPHDPHVLVGVYDATGTRAAGHGPTQSEQLVADVARTGIEDEGVVDGALVVAVPLTTDDERREAFAVRASEPYSVVHNRTYLAWAVMAALAAAVLGVVAGLGRARARRIARPLESLAVAADALGHGDFSVRARRAGIAEVDAASASIERTARRLGSMLERERAFSADASHQLRTPLTAVRVGLESALLTPGADLRATLEEALVGLDRLEGTVVDLLTLARDTTGPQEATDVALLVTEVAQHWGAVLAERDRSLNVQLEPELPPAAVSRPALRTVLDVLLSNALTHGSGAVRLGVRMNDRTVVVEVADQGSGITGDGSRIFARRSPQARGTGIGLALARSLVEADGGRLELTRAVPPVFAVLLAVAPPPNRATPLGQPAQPGQPMTPGTRAGVS